MEAEQPIRRKLNAEMLVGVSAVIIGLVTLKRAPRAVIGRFVGRPGGDGAADATDCFPGVV
ncbi:MAG: hypothetical protein AAGE85_10505 [Pseudomonadota bacterium]